MVQVFLLDCDGENAIETPIATQNRACFQRLTKHGSQGVLWSGDTLFEGTVETLDMLRIRGRVQASNTKNLRE